MAATETRREHLAEQRGPPGLPLAMEMETDAIRAAGRPGEQCEDTCLTVGLAVTTLFTLWLVVWFICAWSTYKGPEFFVAIAAVSGLDPAPDRPELDPEFNLTVRITVRSRLMRSCDDPHTTVQVSYHGFTLASAFAPEVCRIRMYAEDDRTAATTVVARGTRVWLPGPALDSLAADLGRAAAVFDVALTIPRYMKRSHDDDGLVVSCLGRPIGDDGGNALCDVSGLHLT